MIESIIISELESSKEKSPENFFAQVQLGHNAALHKITITNPFSGEQEKRLEWYFEEWLNFPFTDNELRVDYGPGYRVYFGRNGNKIIILLCAGSKKSQSKDIELAKQYWTEYQRKTR